MRFAPPERLVKVLCRTIEGGQSSYTEGVFKDPGPLLFLITLCPLLVRFLFGDALKWVRYD